MKKIAKQEKCHFTFDVFSFIQSQAGHPSRH